MRDYDPTTGRYIQADPLGLVDGASVYNYVRNNPENAVDPKGLTGWYCQRPLGGKPGKKGPPLFNHQYLCVTNPDGTISCGSVTTDGGFLNSKARMTTPKEDYYHPESCEITDDDVDQCYEACVADAFRRGPTRDYGIGPFGDDCQEYASKTRDRCERKCQK